MISRRATKTIAEAYSAAYVSVYGVARNDGKAAFYKDDLYDFLYVRDFDDWFMNLIKSVSTYYTARALTDFIMKLHTGESIQASTSNWTSKQRSALAQRLLRELAEALMSKPAEDSDERAAVSAMQAALELDGYIYKNNVLYVPEESVLDEQEEAGVLADLLKRAALADIPTIAHHLALSAEHYQAERWDDSIGNSRKVLEAVLQQIAERHARDVAHAPMSAADLEKPVIVRDYLERVGLLDRKEKEAVAKTYALLSDAGGHPHIAERDQARLTRHLALTFAQFALLRFIAAGGVDK